MNLFLRQIWALIRKNLLIICVRRSISTFLRALALPLVVVLVVGYSKNFFASPQHWGVSSPYAIRSLEDGLAAAPGRNIVGFIDNGMKGGQVSSVIESVSKTISDAGRTPKSYDSVHRLAQDCASNTKGSSPCYGAVEFLSSPDEGTNQSTKGFWNYTIYGDSSGFIDVRHNNNGREIYLLPLQRAVDMDIVARSQADNTSTLPPTVDDISFTIQGQDILDDSRTTNYLNWCIYFFAVIFVFTMIGLVYHMTSFVATERELGMTNLIDTMLPGGSAIRARAIRQLSTYISFTIVYFPSWLVVGIVMNEVVFPKTSHGIPIGYHIVSGLAFASFSLFGASFFRKAQLSGSILTIIALVFAILPQVIFDQKKAQVAIFSLLFPSANYTYFISGLATWEAANTKVSLTHLAPDRPEDAAWRLALYIHWIFLVVQIIVYPILAFLLEHVLFSTTSKGRILAVPERMQEPAVNLTGFHKTYNPSFFGSIFKRAKKVHAVVDVNLSAFPGQILCLLGPNGSGKSTTLNCIAGQQKVTSGNITIDPTGGLGYAPQSNVIWPELTVEEHIRVFSDLKCTDSVNEEVITELVRCCDLDNKLLAQAQTLSGGQKRKLQLAMMFAGGSAVCCVDEVSTGLDPISRRRIWDILLAERSRRTIIMTTHFLDEADFLADNIVILYKGSLKAEGTSATLKNRFGNGYTVKLPNHIDLDVSLSGKVEKEVARHQIVYRVETAALAAELIGYLERNEIRDYQISGPTMEELFLKTTGDVIHSNESDATPKDKYSLDTHETTMLPTRGNYELTDGRPVSAFKQWWILLCKRFLILRRRYIPYFFLVALPIIGAGVAPLLIKSFNTPMACPTAANLIDYYVSRYDMTYSSDYVNYLVGPSDKLDNKRLEQFADVYGSNRTYFPGYYGYHNVTQLKDSFKPINSSDQLSQMVTKMQAEMSGSQSNYYGTDYVTYFDGGIWLGDTPTVLWQLQSDHSALYMQNLLNNLLSGVPISAGYSDFPSTDIPSVIDFRALTFMVYFGLIMAAYPAFFALYPTNERISNVRSMQYSNGIRPLPLWLSHLTFDGIAILAISVVGVGLLSVSTPIWYGLGYIFIILLFYGFVSALLSYTISMFARSAVTAWFMCALGQVILYFAYFGGLIGIQSSTPFENLEHMNNAVYFGLGIISPIVSLEKALAIGLGQMAFHCNGRNGGSIYLYGGPILYLVLQGIVLFTILLWWDSTFTLPSLRRHEVHHDAEHVEMNSSDVMEERKRLVSKNADLRIESVSKSFGKNIAVDAVTFAVQTSEIFALLGPNGAGKSTIISMVRGDMKPSTKQSSIHIAGYSILSSPIAARANLGVCPQFDSADVLTVTETLRFFAKTRGVQNIDHNVNTVISACGLEPWSHQLAQKLSGGTKRKLSLAVALVGNPRVLVLDEPSSALDANAKRNMWRTLQSIGKGRAVVLTTHSMEEADALADRIGIVSSRMLAIGEREALKKRAGDAFHIHLVSRSAPRTSREELQVMKDWITVTFPDAKVSRETQGGQVRFEVLAEGHDLVGLIKVLEAAKGDLGVEFYSVGKATLDEVFENIVHRFGDQRHEEKKRV